MRDELVAALAARSRLEKEIIAGATLPNQVFARRWSVFRFFNGEFGFGEPFASAAAKLLEADDASVVIVRNETEASLFAEQQLISITRSTPGEKYWRDLKMARKAGPEFPGLDTYAAVADQGSWCAFWDGKEEVGIVAMASEVDLFRYRQAIDILRADRLDVLMDPKSGVRPFDRMIEPWRTALMKNYR